MSRLPIESFEGAARLLARIREIDSDELTFFGGKGDAANQKRPRWVNLAEELRAHYEREGALDEDET